MTALDGRTLTERYCRPGSILGAVSLFASTFSMPASDSAFATVRQRVARHLLDVATATQTGAPICRPAGAPSSGS